MCKKITPSVAIPLWNKLTSSLPFPAPFSFNPSLFYFYRKHYNWKPYYFLLYSNNEVTGVLPLVNTGKAWVSLPHFSYGGVWLDEHEKLLESKLINSAIAIIIGSKCDPGFYRLDIENASQQQGELKHRIFIRSYGDQQDESFIKSEKVTSIFELKSDRKEIFSGLSSNLRRKINKASNSNLVAEVGEIELLDDFYKVYSKNISHLKSLSYGKQFFKDLLTSYQYGRIKVIVVYHNGKPAGSALLASYGRFYENLFFATLQKYRKYYISDWLHWQMIRYVSEDKQNFVTGNKVYSFGRSTVSSSVHQYKDHWPVVSVPLFVYSNINDVRKNTLLKSTWGVLPRFITEPLGTRLIKHIY